MTPKDRTFDLVIDKRAMDCVMCFLDQIEKRMNMYRDELERFLRLVDLKDEDGDINNNEGGSVSVIQQQRRQWKKIIRGRTRISRRQSRR